MNDKSPAVQRICDAATAHFSIRGYDGASLNEIAEMVGIRKASLYSHFKGKDQLFTQVLHDAIAIETGFACELLAAPARDEPGHIYLSAIAARHEQSVHLRYLLRTVFCPPAHLHPLIDTVYIGALTTIANAFKTQLAQSSLATIDQELLAEAYIGIVESLFVEITYAGASAMEKRRQAMWSVFADSLAMRIQRTATLEPS